MASKKYGYISNKRSNVTMNKFNQSVDRGVESQPEISISNIGTMDKNKQSNNITMTDLSYIGVSKSDLKLNTKSELKIINNLNYDQIEEENNQHYNCKNSKDEKDTNNTNDQDQKGNNVLVDGIDHYEYDDIDIINDTDDEEQDHLNQENILDSGSVNMGGK